MANPTKLSYQLQASVSNGIAQSQAVAAAGPLTLNGSLVTGGIAQLDKAGTNGAPSVARRVLIASAGSDASVVFTIRGTDRYGNVQSNTVTGVTSAASQFSALDFATVTSVTASAATAGNITVGTNGVGSSDWTGWNWMLPAWTLAVATSGVAGTIYTWEHTYDDPNVVSPLDTNNASLEAASLSPPKVWPSPTIANVSGDNEARYVDWPHFAGRLTINSGTGLVNAWAFQSGIGSP